MPKCLKKTYIFKTVFFDIKGKERNEIAKVK
jgi:hypothetical protein